MSKRKYHYPPAYYKYRQTHTSISICLSHDLKSTLDALKGEKSYATFIRNLIIKHNIEVAEGVRNATESFMEQGRKQVREQEDNFRVPCSVCGKPMKYSSRDDIWPKAKEVLYQAFSKWGHTDCIHTKETGKIEASKTKTEPSAAKSSTGQQKQNQQKQS
jgi:predicted CopG family antitoxin